MPLLSVVEVLWKESISGDLSNDKDDAIDDGMGKKAATEHCQIILADEHESNQEYATYAMRP